MGGFVVMKIVGISLADQKRSQGRIINGPNL
jgi:hypothetical protein